MILDATTLPALKAFFGWSVELIDEMFCTERCLGSLMSSGIMLIIVNHLGTLDA